MTRSVFRLVRVIGYYCQVRLICRVTIVHSPPPASVERFPPPKSLLFSSFTALNDDDSKSTLSVGARALSKHCHRDHTDAWWGACTGTEKDKNDHAVSIFTKVLDDSSWINIHEMVHDNMVLEVRSSQGYGVRWSGDGKTFRGFLEPQMTDGHAVGWKH